MGKHFYFCTFTYKSPPRVRQLWRHADRNIRTGQDRVQVCAGSRHLQASRPYAGHTVLTQNPPVRGCWATGAPPAARRLHHVATTLWPRGSSFRGASAALVWHQKVVLRAVLPLGRSFLLLFCGWTSLPAPVPLVASGHIVFQKTFRTFTVCFGC